MTIDMIERRINSKCNYFEKEFYKTNKGIAVKIMDEYPLYQDLLCYKIDVKNLIYLLLLENNRYNSSMQKTIDYLSKFDYEHMHFLSGFYAKNRDSFVKLIEAHDIDYLVKIIKKNADYIDAEFLSFIFNSYREIDILLSNIDLDFFEKVVTIQSYYKTISEEKNLRKEKPLIRSYLGNKYDVDKIQNKIKELYELARKKTCGVTVRSIDSKLKNYKKALIVLKNEVGKDEIVESISNAEKLDDDGIKDDILTFIYEHNMEYWLKLEKEYIEKTTNSIENFTIYFASIGLNFNSIPDGLKKKIMEDSIDVVKDKVVIIKRFADNKYLFEVLANMSMDNLLLLNLYLNKQFVTCDFISRNLSTLLNASNFDNLKNNIDFLESEINFKRYNDLSFLLVDNSIIINNINLLNKYNIPFKNARDLSFIKTPILEKLCLFIEVGLESFIMSNPDILNADMDLAKRVLLTREIGDDISVDGKLDELILYKTSFFASEKEVNSFALTRDNTKYNGSSEIYLSNLDSTLLSYVVSDEDEGNEVLIPKMRVTSQPESLQRIIRSSLYSKKQIETLEKNSIR